MTVIDGTVLSKQVKEQIADEVKRLGIRPGLAVILVGEDPSSVVYVNSKEKAAAKAGFRSEVIRMPESTTQAGLLEQVRKFNEDPGIHGILVQSPPPPHIDENEIIEAIAPDKDVDCFHPRNFGRLFAGTQTVVPCTPKGVMRLIDHYGIELKGKNAVVIGRSNIVGKPTAMLLLQRHATVTIAHSRTQNLAEVARNADVLVTAIGKPRFVTADMVKQGAVVIDIGINRVDDPSSEKGYRLVGDVDYDAVAPKTSAITPVPGGVGAMTIAMLLENTLEFAKRAAGIA